jgi:hypothetical protein
MKVDFLNETITINDDSVFMILLGNCTQQERNIYQMLCDNFESLSDQNFNIQSIVNELVDEDSYDADKALAIMRWKIASGAIPRAKALSLIPQGPATKELTDSIRYELARFGQVQDVKSFIKKESSPKGRFQKELLDEKRSWSDKEVSEESRQALLIRLNEAAQKFGCQVELERRRGDIRPILITPNQRTFTL